MTVWPYRAAQRRRAMGANRHRPVKSTCANCGAIDDDLRRDRPVKADFGRSGEEPPPEGRPPKQ